MAALKNNWIGYFDRSYTQVKATILQKIGITVPEMTDHTESNPFIVIVNVFMALYEMINYYIDNIAREVYLHSARQYRSGQKIAKMFQYRLKLYSSASCEVRFYVPTAQAEDILIPMGTVLDGEGIKFRTTTNLTLVAGQLYVDGIALQEEILTTSFVSTGEANQRFTLAQNAVDKSMAVSVNGINYSFLDHLFDAKEGDLVYTTEVTQDQEIQLVFGDGFDGVIPTLNDTVNITYSISQGAAGNIAADIIDTITSPITSPIKVEVINRTQATGGYGLETLEDLKNNIPAYNRTLNRAVTEDDFKDIAESYSGVAKALPDYNCGAAVDVYIVPTGDGLATQVLLDNVKDLFYDETRLILMDVNILPAGRINAKLNIKLKVYDVYNKIETIQRVTDNLIAFFSSDNQSISGSVNIGDIYQVVENTEGVEHSEVLLLSTIPEATITSGTHNLNWTRTLMSSSTGTIRWSIKYIGSNKYELRRENSFLGQFSIGDTVSQSQIVFNVQAGSYVVGDTWQFTTYNYNGTIILDEPSIVSIQPQNINLITTGGV